MNVLKIFVIFFTSLILVINPIVATLLLVYFIVISADKNIYSGVFHLILGGILLILGMKFFSLTKIYNFLYQDISYLHYYQFNQAIKLITHNYLNLESVIPLILPTGVILIMYGVLRCKKNRKQLTNDFRKLSNKISDSQNTDYNDSICFGIKYNYDEEIAITDKELNHHMLVIGTTGSGKTTTLMNIVNSCCQRNLPLIYVDGKGSIKLANNIDEICKKYNRRLKVFSLDPNSNIPNISCYNPLAFGNFTEWKNKIITLTQEAEGRGQEHYSLQEQSYISLVCEILNQSGAYVDLEGLIAYIREPSELQKLANRISPELGMRLVKISKETNNSDIIKVLETFYYSHYGQLFSTIEQDPENIINLPQCIANGEIVLFLLDAASYKRDTNLLGRLIINDINAAWASFGRIGIRQKGYCVFDEFASYATSNMASILSMQRDNGLHAVVGTQSINAISVESSNVKRVAVELVANCNTFIIHKLNDPKDIELLVNTIGTKSHVDISHSINPDGELGKLNTRINTVTKIKAQDIRELKSGIGIVCRTIINLPPMKVQIHQL